MYSREIPTGSEEFRASLGEGTVGPPPGGESGEMPAPLHPDRIEQARTGVEKALEAPLHEDQLLPGDSAGLLTVDTTETMEYHGKLHSRSARQGEEHQLAMLELRAFRDVYGEHIDSVRFAALYEIFEERISLFGDWIKVMEDARGNLCGMMISCPFKVVDHPEAITQYDMTSNRTLHEIFDPAGDTVYIVNLAVDPDAPKNVRYMLYGNMLSEAVTNGVHTAYLESRLPSLKAWCVEQTGLDPAQIPEEQMDGLAEQYWRLTVKRGDSEVPYDPLLRIFTQSGCKPLRLVKEAWSKDNPSAGYGVFCRRDLPTPELVLRSPVLRKAAGNILARFSSSNYLMRKVFDR